MNEPKLCQKRALDSETGTTTLSIAHALTSVILEGKRDSRRHSTTSLSENVVVAGTSSQMYRTNFFGEKK